MSQWLGFTSKDKVSLDSYDLINMDFARIVSQLHRDLGVVNKLSSTVFDNMAVWKRQQEQQVENMQEVQQEDLNDLARLDRQFEDLQSKHSTCQSSLKRVTTQLQKEKANVKLLLNQQRENTSMLELTAQKVEDGELGGVGKVIMEHLESNKRMLEGLDGTSMGIEMDKQMKVI